MIYRTFSEEELERFAYVGDVKAAEEILRRVVNQVPEWVLARAAEALTCFPKK